jgi:nitrite reductase (NADH) large subunit
MPGTSSTASRSTRGARSTRIDRETRTVHSVNGISETYDRLVIATGSVPFIIPVPGKDLAGVVTYRDLDDVHAMMLAAKSRGRAVVIGGGLLGLEAAAGLNERAWT